MPGVTIIGRGCGGIGVVVVCAFIVRVAEVPGPTQTTPKLFAVFPACEQAVNDARIIDRAHIILMDLTFPGD